MIAATSERGWPGDGVLSLGGRPSQTWQDLPDLRWPESLAVFDAMLRDPMVRAVERAVRLPVVKNGWRLAGDDVAPDVTAFVTSELGLNDAETGRSPRRPAGGVRWQSFLGDLMLAVRYGHMVFERVYEMRDGRAHLTKLAPRHPRSLDWWYIDANGELLGVGQNVAVMTGQKLPSPGTLSAGTTGIVRWEQRTIPAEQLVVHTVDREAGDWLGRSMLSSMWRPWFGKDQMQRFGLIAADRSSSLIPVITVPAGADRDRALALVSSMRTGEESGAVLEDGQTLDMHGDKPGMDVLPWVRFFNEEIALAGLAMFLSLGHDSGARSLGDTFIAAFCNTLNGIVTEVEATITEEVIRPLVAINFGDDEPYPQLVGGTILADQPVTADSLKALADAGILTPDQGLEDTERRRLRLPSSDGQRNAADRQPAPPAPAFGGTQ